MRDVSTANLICLKPDRAPLFIGPSSSVTPFDAKTPLKVQLLGAGLMALQVADFALTQVGIRRFGIHAEGNVFVKQMIATTDPLTGLLLCKVAALLMIIVLVHRARCYRRLTRILSILCFVYFTAVVCPWIYFLGRVF